MPTYHVAEDRITIHAESFTALLDRHPPALSIRRGEQEIWRSGPAFGQARYGETWLAAHALDELRLTEEGVQMTAITADPRRSFLLALGIDEDGLSITWQADRAPDEWRESAYLAPAGHWYGMGQLQRAVYPLERGLIRADPFITAGTHPDGLLPIETPAWITSRGVGVALDHDDDLGMGLNHALAPTTAGPEIARPLLDSGGLGDGLWQVAVRRQERLAYRITVGPDVATAHARQARYIGRPADRPAIELLRTPQWTTWARYKTQIDQATVLRFGHLILGHGFPAGLFGIDDRWQAHYGDTEFDRTRFPDPRAMVAALQDMGFLVTLWLTPFVNRDAANFTEGRRRGYFLRRPDTGDPAMTRWWQGEGALVDFSNPEAAAWWLEKTQALQDRYGVDGFKFDGGDGNWVPAGAVSAGDVGQNGYSDAYVAWVAQHFRWCEVRVGWRAQKAPLLFRLADKESHWGDENGLRAIMPQMLHVGLAGYPFVFADMIGGNNYGERKADKELLIRWAEVNAALPAMQFSIPPWEFDRETVEICRACVRVHEELMPAIERAMREAVSVGAPIVRPLNWRWDDERAHHCADQFLLGDEFCVAPVVTPAALTRDVLLPPGQWRDYWTGARHVGPTVIRSYPAPLDLLPLFQRDESAELPPST
jgi:alpha-glucosidase (family GH31 glycosyl hydrolase)